MKNFLKFKTIDKVIYFINFFLIGIGLGLIYKGVMNFMGYDVFTQTTVSLLAICYGVIVIANSIYSILRVLKLNENQQSNNEVK